MSGVPGRSGRRPDPERAHCRALIARAVTEEDQIELLRLLTERARVGDAAHAKLLLGYMFGPPAYVEGPEPEVEPIRILEVVHPRPKCGGHRNLPPQASTVSSSRSVVSDGAK